MDCSVKFLASGSLHFDYFASGASQLSIVLADNSAMLERKKKSGVKQLQKDLDCLYTTSMIYKDPYQRDPASISKLQLLLISSIFCKTIGSGCYVPNLRRLTVLSNFTPHKARVLVGFSHVHEL